MSHFGQNLNQAFTNKGLSPFHVALELGIDPSLMSKVIHGVRKPPKGFAEKLSAHETLGLSLETLKSWQARDAYEETFRASGLTPLEGLYKVPLKGCVQAGQFTLHNAPDDIVYVDWYDLSEFSPDIFCLEVRGDSMYPPIPDGAVLLLREARDLKNKGVYVIETADGESTLKLFEYSGQGTKLIPLNPAHTEISITEIKIQRLFEVLEYKVKLENRLLARP